MWRHKRHKSAAQRKTDTDRELSGNRKEKTPETRAKKKKIDIVHLINEKRYKTEEHAF